MVATPHFYVEPTVLIGTVEVQCHFQLVTLIPREANWKSVETYCNPGGEAPGPVAWGGIMRIRMSYGSDSSWEFFSGLGTGPQEVTIYPGDPGTVGASAANPEASFDAYITMPAFIPEHEVGGSATYDLEYRVIGEPAFATSTP